MLPLCTFIDSCAIAVNGVRQVSSERQPEDHRKWCKEAAILIIFRSSRIFSFRALREFLLIFLALQSSRLLVNASQRVTCEKLESHHWEVDERNLQTCFIQHQKTNQLGATIGSPFEQNCTGLWFDGNKMSYLPINIGDKFPNLQAISAEECGLKAVGWEDFKDLTKLEILWLTKNSLEMIPGNTFRDCVNLQKVYLSEFDWWSVEALILLIN